MLISCHTKYVVKRFGEYEGIKILRDAGFDAIDFNMNGYAYDAPLYKGPIKDFISFYQNLRAYCEKIGIKVGQAHAVDPTYRQDPQTDQAIFETLVRNIQAASLLECPYIVIHPNIPPAYKYDYFRAETKEINLDFYGRLLPYLKQYGVIGLVENMFNWDEKKGAICPTVCSYGWELKEYADMIDSKWFGVCLDIGHANLTPDPAVHMIEVLGSRIKALHVHDNNGVSDQHLCPYLGTTDWDAVTAALSAIKYSGTFNLESDKTVYANRMFELSPVETVKQMYRVAAELSEKIKY
ncbi:MAG: sugar phosphate isomerase/epimerase [Clostridiales bacterium]|nr:sugar phosphate isomerase/epimerase [Clostridiales bacterium]